MEAREESPKINVVVSYIRNELRTKSDIERELNPNPITTRDKNFSLNSRGSDELIV
ncbi:hypothetical protein D3C76_1737540 [compost metagenome]